MKIANFTKHEHAVLRTWLMPASDAVQSQCSESTITNGPFAGKA